MDNNLDLGERFVKLALAIGEHVPGYVDAYFGPEEWQTQVKQLEKLSLSNLTDQIKQLSAEIAETDSMDPQRKDYLARHLTAMQMTLRLLSGEKVSLADEAEALYDIRPEWTDESNFEEAYKILDDVLPAGNSLQERMLVWERSLEIPFEKARELLPTVINKLHALTRQKFDLPEGDDFTVEFVSDKPWMAYNWYLGNSKSRIEINTDLPARISQLPVLIAHEAYPGHHTDLSIKEAKLVKESRYYEFMVNLLNAPSAVMAEGIATTALKTILADDELEQWLREELLPSAGMSHIDPGRILAIRDAEDKVEGIYGNAAFMLHDQNRDAEEINQYMQRYGILTEERARHIIKFISNPLDRSYIFTYRIGYDLLEELFRHGNRVHYFKRLFEEPVTPSQIRQWIKNESQSN